VQHHYADKSVRLHVFRVEAFTGEPHGHEGQPLAWVPLRELGQYEFPAANLPIVSAVQLPDRVLITPEPDDHTAFLAAVEQACRRGIRLLQLRAHSLGDPQYRALAKQVHAITAIHNCGLILNRAPRVIADLPCAGWHLSQQTVASLVESDLRRRPRWLSISCHQAPEVAQALSLGADFLLLSPVMATPSHPEQAGMGWGQFAGLAAQANRPVYALGGVSESDLHDCWTHGGQGIAAIRALWPAV
jgi:8-oxo-dGTP diphosphatase